MELVSTSMRLDPECLPPTERAMTFHAYRVHLQVAQWKTLDLDCLNPLKWGWYLKNRIMTPEKTDQEPATERLLQVIRCSCKTTNKNMCVRNVCSCFRSGLKCVAACSGCRGESCGNSTIHDEVPDDEENIDSYFD